MIATRMTPLRSLGSLILRSIARAVLRIRVEGDPALLPRSGAVIVASNHASSADPVLIGAFLNKLGRPLNWLGKRELVETPVIGWFMRQVPIHPFTPRQHVFTLAWGAAVRRSPRHARPKRANTGQVDMAVVVSQQVGQRHGLVRADLE